MMMRAEMGVTIDDGKRDAGEIGQGLLKAFLPLTTSKNNSLILPTRTCLKTSKIQTVSLCSFKAQRPWQFLQETYTRASTFYWTLQ